MGRTPTTSLGRRSISAKDNDKNKSINQLGSYLEDVDDSQQQFRRRKPRIGTQYQTKAPKCKSNEEGAWPRPKPDLMSAELPHLTEEEASEAQDERKFERLAHPQLPDETLLSVVVSSSPGYGSERVPPGGLCVHRPRPDSMNGFLAFAQPWILSLEATTQSETLGSSTSSDVWNQQLLFFHNDVAESALLLQRRDKHNTSPSSPAPPKRGRPSKQRGVKRKLIPVDQEDYTKKSSFWDIVAAATATTNTHQGSKSRMTQLVDAEADETVLEYLQLRHNGDEQSARVSAMVDLTSGRATKARKSFERQWNKEYARQLPSDYPKLWRERFEGSEKRVSHCRLALQGTKAMYSSHRRDPKPVVKMGLGLRSRSKFDKALSSDDDFKRAWSSVLAFGHTLEQELKASCGENRRKKPLFSCVISFVDHVCSLPPAEEVFGRRHVLVDEISKCMSGIIDCVFDARNMQSKLFDAIYDGKKEGVDISSFSKLLDEADRIIPIELDESDTWRRNLQVVADWQSQLDVILEKNDKDQDMPFPDGYDDLTAMEALVKMGSIHGIGCKSLVQLEAKMESAYQLRDRIREWQRDAETGAVESIKTVAAFVRDANRLKLRFPEVSFLLRVFRDAESWVDRANIAIRSRMGMSEIQSLIQRAREMPVDLSEYTDKLLSRVRVAEEWLNAFKQAIVGDSCLDEKDMLVWMSRTREALNNGKQALLHEMASEGSRIPVEIDFVKVLQVELDAKNWSLKAKKWIPDEQSQESNASKRGRLEDLRDHVEKAEALRERLILSEEDKRKWIIDGETELRGIVDAAEAWFDKNKALIEGDNRRSNGRACVSLAGLRQIVDDGNSIFANIGSASVKMAKVLAQAEGWFEKHRTLLDRCGVRSTCVTLSELDAAVKDASSDIAIDLVEAIELRNIKEKVVLWVERSLAAAPKRSKRPVKGRSSGKNRCTVVELEELIKEAAELPVDTSEDIARLKEQLLGVQNWKSQAHQELGDISVALTNLRQTINAVYGPPVEFSRKRGVESVVSVQGGLAQQVVSEEADIETGEEKKGADESSQTDTASTTDSEHEAAHSARSGLNRCGVERLISGLLKTSKLMGVGTVEEEAAHALESISRWCFRSLKYLDSSKEIFDKRFFGAFDRFLSEGNDILQLKENPASLQLGDETIRNDLLSSCCGVVSDQLTRLETLRRDRQDFVLWCNQAKDVLQSGSRIPFDVLNDLSEKCLDFPPVTDLLQKIRNLQAKANKWVCSARVLLVGNANRMSMPEAKNLLDEVDKLNLSCDESKMLRNAIRSARGWANRVKRSKLEEGATHIDDVKGLLEEHEFLKIEMPDELTQLRQAMKCYCLCRRPYGGFMIGCDTCEEWYHGPCIGISQARADRFNKYMCIRCCTARVYKASASSIASLIRKWTNNKERKKARQVEAQKHQRKVRKETKEIENLQAEISAMEQLIIANNSDVAEKIPSDQSTLVYHGADIEDPPSIPVKDKLETRSDNSDSRGDIVNTTHECEKPDTCKESEDSTENPISVSDAKNRMEEAIRTRQRCESRLVALSNQAALRSATERREDLACENLQRWFVRVRSLVLAPSTEAQAVLSRPREDGSLSIPMSNLRVDAEIFGIDEMADVQFTISAFDNLAWSLRAMSILSRRPSLVEMKSLCSHAEHLTLPDEKALRMMQSLSERASSWQRKAKQSLAAKPDESKPICLEVLKDLAEEVENIPLRLPEELMLETAIDDKGARHCVCGGPSDGSVMLSCDKCERWFHGRCMGVTKEDSESLTSWICLPCGGIPSTNTDTKQSEGWIPVSDGEETDSCSSVAKDQLSWPPFGLLGSQQAQDALGGCCAIPDDVEELIPIVTKMPDTMGEFARVSSFHNVELTRLPLVSMSLAERTVAGVTPEPSTDDVNPAASQVSSISDIMNANSEECRSLTIEGSLLSHKLTVDNGPPLLYGSSVAVDQASRNKLLPVGDVERSIEIISPPKNQRLASTSEYCGSVEVSLDLSQGETSPVVVSEMIVDCNMGGLVANGSSV